ncbi:nitrilase [Microvirga flocculans]|uniref:Nitrilase n=1 Tax=Microvirga flocculans TaxID=217168 RepID=A0A7W6N6Q4_9HYPH|nr:carbon-nitrogen hydrolase family protein [Microvirga flocculans]MBB4038837.1 nitrilase [Microvirga flocculans]
MTTVAALQIGTDPAGTQATLARILSYAGAIKEAGAKLVVMPEALLGGYPKGSDFGARVGFRTPEGRAAFRAYWESAIDVPGPETDALAVLSAETGASLVVGAIERDGYTLYCTALFFDPQAGLVAKHRKLMPTGSERLVWGFGDGSTLPVIETAAGRIGAAICWENYMPLLRTAMYAKGVEIWCAPTVDEREIWQTSMRHIAYEGRCYVVSACQVLPAPQALGVSIENWPADRPLIRGGSVIVSPMGEILAGPLFEKEGLVVAKTDRGAIAEARYDLDVTGHYARPDVFSLQVDEREKRPVRIASDRDPSEGAPQAAPVQP